MYKCKECGATVPLDVVKNGNVRMCQECNAPFIRQCSICPDIQGPEDRFCGKCAEQTTDE